MPARCGSTTSWACAGCSSSRTAPAPLDGAYVTYPLPDLLGAGRAGKPARALPRGRRGSRHRAGGHVRTLWRSPTSCPTACLWFERRDGRIRPPAEWRRLAAACVSTHDLPTLAGWWNGADIAEKRALSLLVDPAAEQTRMAEKAALIALLRQAGLLSDDD